MSCIVIPTSHHLVYLTLISEERNCKHICSSGSYSLAVPYRSVGVSYYSEKLVTPFLYVYFRVYVSSFP